MPTEEEKLDAARKEGAMEQALKDIGNDVRELKEKIDKLGLAVSQIPCSEHRANIRNLEEKIKIYGAQSVFVWGALGLFILITITSVYKSNHAENQIESLRKDLTTLEKVSYGYNEYMRNSKQ